MTVEMGRWLVPDGIEDVLPTEAWQIEQWRRELLSEFCAWGYELVIPPLVEFTQSLLTGKATDLKLDTCQLVDQVSGKMMGIRADITPQIARIDAHRLASKLPTRLCYAGEVLRARPDAVSNSRSPIQVGAELFGHAGVQSDIEVMELMLASSERLGLTQLTLALGHVGVFKSLSKLLSLTSEQRQQAQDILLRKSIPEWQEWCDLTLVNDDRLAKVMRSFPRLCGEASQVLVQAESLMLNLDADVDACLSRLKRIVQHLNMTHTDLVVHLDLSDLRGFQYHTGVVFGVIEPKQQRMIASGGRYDGTAKDLGLSRPATGFSMDLRQLMDLSLSINSSPKKRILAPAVADMKLVTLIQQLRQEGHSVLIGFPDVDWQSQLATCDMELIKDNDQWALR